MGGCAGKPKDLDLDEAPAPVEAPAAPEKTEAETVPQVTVTKGGSTTWRAAALARAGSVKKKLEKKDDETKEEPLLDLSEPAPEAAKIEEVTEGTETKSVLEELVPVESKAKEAEKPAEAVEVAKEEKKEVAETVAVPEKLEVEASAPKSEEKTEK